MMKLNNIEKRALLEERKVITYLNFKQLIKLMWLELIRDKRIDLFYNNLLIGKSVICAYEDSIKKNN